MSGIIMDAVAISSPKLLYEYFVKADIVLSKKSKSTINKYFMLPFCILLNFQSKYLDFWRSNQINKIIMHYELTNYLRLLISGRTLRYPEEMLQNDLTCQLYILSF
ncbi:MAG TPA: hypothetical protein VFT71_06340 [Candidatus Nitrosocosmicus sp.]|nr:hypothetical protein [Candidatus Nitrosocosmicus sp.]